MKKKLSKWLMNAKSEFALKCKSLCLIGLILLGTGFQTRAANPQQGKLNLNASEITYKEIFKEIQKQTGYVVMYNNADLNKNESIEVDFNNVDLDEALKEILDQKGLTFQVKEDFIILEKDRSPKKIEGQQQEKKEIKGTVTDSEGVPLPGVSVVIKGTNIGVATDIDGNYSLELESDKEILIFSFVGMLPQEKNYTGQLVLNVELSQDTEGLEEVVVTGYQVISKERATGSFDIINQDILESKITNNIIDKLNGVVAGMEVDNRGKITIRGLSTLRANTQPLIILDGYPLNADISTINPKDIEQVTVLKDAAAASIWGARASNGVIVITTKKSKKDKISYDFSASLTTRKKQALNTQDILSSKELIELQKEVFDYYHEAWASVDNYGLYITDAEKIFYDVEQGRITDAEGQKQLNDLGRLDNSEQIKDLALQNPFIGRYDLSISGREDKHSFLISGNFVHEKGDAKYQKNSSYNILFKDEFKYSDRLKFDVGLNYYHFEDKSSPVDYSSLLKSPQYQMLVDQNGNHLPTYKDYRSEKVMAQMVEDGLLDETFYPLKEREQIDNENVQNHTRLQLGLDYKIIEGLNFSLKYQYETGNSSLNRVYDKNSLTAKELYNNFTGRGDDGMLYHLVPEGGIIDYTNKQLKSYNLRTQLNFNKVFREKHSLTALLGAEKSQTVNKTNRNREIGIDVNSLNDVLINEKEISSFSEPIAPNTYPQYNANDYDEKLEVDDRFVSFFGNFGYTFDDKYSLTASARIDQSNLFGTDKKYRYKPLWSVGGKWVISNEGFFNSEVINHLNLRASYGSSGNVAKQYGPYLIFLSDYNSWAGLTSNFVFSAPNDKLRWETTETFNIGTEIALLDNRLNGKIDLYKKNSYDLLSPKVIDPTLGFEQITLNVGEMQNKGIELTLNSKNISTANFSWFTSLNFSYNKNNLEKIYDKPASGTEYFYTFNVEGKPSGALYTYKWAGLSEEGDPQIYDSEGNATQRYLSDVEDVSYQGTYIPPYAGGITNNFNYKNFNFSFLIVYKGGHHMKANVPSLNRASDQRMSGVYRNRWRKPGDEKITDIPRYTGKYNYIRQYIWEKSDIHVIPADYIKLQSINLNYNFNDNLCKKLKVDRMVLGLQVENLYTWVKNDLGQDPNVTTLVNGSMGYPQRLNYTLNLNINF
ncbi:SusC/RagA family TonB-linked outer membrane protein [Marinifilum fragile]|uniref:SusC/RagA family TonB-linked outer membrane protein n=1 Tax=Marinifilum fragile TaxID=570161 RepID=UPI002AA7655F|nr:SusC/RagA family TonB-linked outer membrane protein [Marinifilum fragile]